MVNEEDAFASVLTLKKNYMVMVICEILILLLYCGFYITIVRRISKKSDELNEDLNGLKEINDKIGHIAGDTLIITASYALQEIFLDNSYRVGGDEFLILCPHHDHQQAEKLIEQLQESFHYVNSKGSTNTRATPGIPRVPAIKAVKGFSAA